jgi:hypothetical protein
VDEYQLVKPFFNNTYRLSFGKMACVTVGYSDNKWITQTAEPFAENQTRYLDQNGKVYEIPHGLITYSAPSILFGYHYALGGLVSQKNSEVILDDYDKKHAKKYVPCWGVNGTIDLMYAPVVNVNTQIIYSPYGYYVPRTLEVTAPIKKRHFGVNMKMIFTTPYVFGFYMDIGLFPSAFPTDVDNKMNVNAKAGIMINFSRGKK